MDEQEIPYDEQFKRCGTKLTDEKVQELKEKFNERADNENLVLGTLEIGTVVDGYTIIEYLGSGGFGTVCLVLKNELYFAMKLMLVKKASQNPPTEFKLLHEALQSPEHQSLLTALEWKQFNSKESKKLLQNSREGTEKLCYMIMKLAGPSLNILLEEQEFKEDIPVPLLRGIPIMRNALRSLRVFHERRLVHHDIKLENFAMDLSDENRIILLDLGMAAVAARNFTFSPGFMGTSIYASRRALKGELQSYRDDYESWFNSLLYFIHGGLPWKDNEMLLEKKEKFWSAPDAVDDPYLMRILKHINYLSFYETINYDFVDCCLQDVIAEQNGAPYIPYIYQIGHKGRLIITKGSFSFATKYLDKSGRKKMCCSARNCSFSVFVAAAEYEKAKDGDEAIIIDITNIHSCLEM